jgi:hypothetical protein
MRLLDAFYEDGKISGGVGRQGAVSTNSTELDVE